MKENPKPKLISLFCGAGGLDKGFELAGYSTTWASIPPCKAYQA